MKNDRFERGDDSMRLGKLTKAQMEKIYQERMKEDFPPNELDPLEVINESVERGNYECFGLMDGEGITGYTFLIKHGEDYLIDYLAIYPEWRKHGLGGELVRLLGEYLVHAKSIILEVEDPEFARNAVEKEMRAGRLEFYLRRGFRDTGVRVTYFEAPFIILEMEQTRVHTAEEIKALYEMHYKVFLPDGMYEKNVIMSDTENGL